MDTLDSHSDEPMKTTITVLRNFPMTALQLWIPFLHLNIYYWNHRELFNCFVFSPKSLLLYLSTILLKFSSSLFAFSLCLHLVLEDDALAAVKDPASFAFKESEFEIFP